jgi:dCTP deaminase
MITPFHERGVINGMSFGLSCSGYDIRIAEDRVIRPGGFVLASTMEKFDIPKNAVAEIKDKSTLARLGIAVQNTIAEPGWRGFLTLEISNHSQPRRWWEFWKPDNTVHIKRGSPIAQAVFQFLDEPTEHPYCMGKYQDQEAGPQGPRFETTCGISTETL